MDVKLLFPRWNYIKEHLLYNLFSLVHRMFLDLFFLEVENSLNPKAGSLFLNDRTNFFEQAVDCVDTSIEELYVNYTETTFVVSKPKEQEIEALKQLRAICQEKATKQQKK